MNGPMPLPRAVQPDADRPSARVSMIDSAALIGNAKLIHIQHHGEIYALRQTRLGKLILTK